MKTKLKLLAVAAVAMVLSGPAVALAQDTPAPEPTFQSILMSAAVHVVPVLATALAALLAAALAALTRKLSVQAEESKLALVGHRASVLAEGIVRDIEVSLKPELEAAAADGVLTDAELHRLKATAMDRLMTSLGERGLAELQDVLKLSSGSVGAFLSGLIEAALDKMKAGKPGATDKVTTIQFTPPPELSPGAVQAALASLEKAPPPTPRV